MEKFRDKKQECSNEQLGINEDEVLLWLELAACFEYYKDGFNPSFPKKSVRRIFKTADKEELQGMLISLLAELRKFEPDGKWAII